MYDKQHIRGNLQLSTALLGLERELSTMLRTK